jgi:hypothetical protein
MSSLMPPLINDPA